MKELAIQAEVGRRLRSAIGRTHSRHALKVNSGENDDIPALIEQLIGSGEFTSADKAGLQALPPATIRALAERFSGDEIEDVITKFNSSPDGHEDFIHAGRAKALRRELPGERAVRNFRIAAAHQRRLMTNAQEDGIAEGMLPPSSRRSV